MIPPKKMVPKSNPKSNIDPLINSSGQRPEVNSMSNTTSNQGINPQNANKLSTDPNLDSSENKTQTNAIDEVKPEGIKPTEPVVQKPTGPNPLEKLKRVKALYAQLQQVRVLVNKSAGQFLKFKGDIGQDVDKALEYAKKTKQKLIDFEKSCLENSSIIAECETLYNPTGSIFVGIKRRIPQQSEFPQPPLKHYKPFNEILKQAKAHQNNPAAGKHFIDRTSIVKVVGNNLNSGKVLDLKTMILEWTKLHRHLEYSGTVDFSGETYYESVNTLVFNLVGVFNAYILVKVDPKTKQKSILKLNFLSPDEINKAEFDLSEHFVFRSLTMQSLRQLPFPLSVPDDFTPGLSDPLPSLFDWLYSFHNIFEIECVHCHCITSYSPNTQAKFLPTIIRHFDRESKKYLPYHYDCALNLRIIH